MDKYLCPSVDRQAVLWDLQDLEANAFVESSILAGPPPPTLSFEGRGEVRRPSKGRSAGWGGGLEGCGEQRWAEKS